MVRIWPGTTASGLMPGLATIRRARSISNRTAMSHSVSPAATTYVSSGAGGGAGGGVAAEGGGDGVEGPGVNVRVEKTKGVRLEEGSKDPPIRRERATP